MDEDILNIHKLPNEQEATPETLTQLSCERFIAELAGKKSFPGGGSACAYVGAIAAALGNMVGSLTLDNEKYASVKNEILELKFDADVLQADFIWLVAKDAEAFSALSDMYNDKDMSDSEKIDEALENAAAIPLQVMRKCSEAICVIRRFGEIGNKNVLSDAACAAALISAVVKASAVNVYVNTKEMSNKQLAEQLNNEAASILESCSAQAEDYFNKCLAECSN